MFARMRKTARVAVLTAGVTAICGAALIPATAQMTTFGKAFTGTNIQKKKARPKVEAVPNPESPYYQGQRPNNGGQALQPVNSQPQLNPVQYTPQPAPAPQPAPLPPQQPQMTAESGNGGQVYAQAEAQGQSFHPGMAQAQTPGASPSIQQKLEEMYRRDGREMPQMDYQSMGLQPPAPVYQEYGAGQGAPHKPSFLQRWAPGLARHLPGWNRGSSNQQQNRSPQQSPHQQTPPQYAGQAGQNGQHQAPYGSQPANLRGNQYPAGHPLANQARPQGQTGQGPVIAPGKAVPPMQAEMRPVPTQNGGPALSVPGSAAPNPVAASPLPRLPVVDVMAPANPANNGPLPPVASDLAATPAQATKKDELFLTDEATADQTTTDSVLLTDDVKKPAAVAAAEQPAASQSSNAASGAATANGDSTGTAATAATGTEITPESLVAPVAPVSPYSGKKLETDSVALTGPDLLDGDEEDEDEEMLLDSPAAGTPAANPPVAAAAPSQADAPPSLQAPATADVRPGGGNSLPVAPPVDVDEQASSEEAQLASRPAMTGFKGFCPVTLRNKRKLVESDPQFQAERDGVVYQFASAEALAEFQIAPEKYVPARSGQDVVLTAGGEQKPGTLDHAVWFRGKLYLFATAESRQTFVTAPAKYAVP